jgi:hypothetical protein
MGTPRLGVGAFSLRDYVAYLFPGVVVLGSVVVIEPRFWDIISKDAVAASLIILVGGYVAGFASRRVGTLIITPLLNRIQGNPYRQLLRPNNRRIKKSLDDRFRALVLNRLEAVWGKELVGGREDNLLFLCWRELEFEENANTAYLSRLIDLYNLSLNLLVPTLLIGLSLLIKREFVYALFALVTFLCMCKARFDMMVAFARNVYRTWYVAHRDAVSPKDQQLSAEQ